MDLDFTVELVFVFVCLSVQLVFVLVCLVVQLVFVLICLQFLLSVALVPGPFGLLENCVVLVLNLLNSSQVLGNRNLPRLGSFVGTFDNSRR